MAITRYNPTWEFDTLSREFDRLINSFSPVLPHKAVDEGYLPLVNILEDEHNIYFEIEVPGLSREDVRISINDDNLLTIKGEKKFERDREAKVGIRQEREYGNFTRTFQMPEYVNKNKVEAHYKNGVLYLQIAKSEAIKIKEKEVKIQ